MLKFYMVPLMTVLIAACSSDEPQSHGRADGLVDPVDIRSGELTAGFATGRLRWKVDMPSFRISKRPITRAQYAECVGAGGCQEVADDGYCTPAARGEVAHYGLGDEESPMTCVPPTDAAAYCSWVGGSLPSLTEWMYASRGPTPQRYAWGKGKATCERHPRAMQPISEEAAMHARVVGMPVPKQACGASREQGTLRVGEHRHVASTFGVEDVLLTPGELLRPATDSRFPPCREDGGGCLVAGLDIGAMDYVIAMPKAEATATASGAERSGKMYDFRCVTREN